MMVAASFWGFFFFFFWLQELGDQSRLSERLIQCSGVWFEAQLQGRGTAACSEDSFIAGCAAVLVVGAAGTFSPGIHAYRGQAGVLCC